MTAQQGNVVPKQAGVLPIRPAQTSSPVDAPKSAKAKAAAQDGVKIKIRRLPPGLTEQEFVATLGNVWKAGNGKVGWFEYHPGHIPKRFVANTSPKCTAVANEFLVTQCLQRIHTRICLASSQGG